MYPNPKPQELCGAGQSIDTQQAPCQTNQCGSKTEKGEGCVSNPLPMQYYFTNQTVPERPWF
jgi:hypothetical protein